MHLSRRRFAIALGSLPLFAGFGARAQGKLRPGSDYTELKVAQPVDAPPGKVEVVEFFWYGCPHCYTLEPYIESWQKKLPSDAYFRRIPAIFNDRWAHDAAIFYTFEALGLTEKLHRPLFDAIHKNGLKTDNRQALAQWLGRNGVDVKKFDEAFKSFGVQSQLRRAQQLGQGYRIEGTPTMAVQGRYTVSPEQGKSQEGLLANVDYLIGLARQGVRK